MGLTSNTVLALAAVMTVLLFFGTVRFWPRLAGRSRSAVLGRVVVLLATQVVLLASLGLAANKESQFYASWSDLFGQVREPGIVIDHDAAAGADGPVRVLKSRPVDVPGGSRPEAGGQIQQVRIDGAESGISSPASVYLPPEYFRPENGDRTFPAAVVITGYPGTAENLIKTLHYPQTVHELARKGRMQPMVLVMLRPTVAPPRDTECVDVPDGPQTETFFAEDLPSAVSAHYRVGAEPRNWGVIGNSTGGYCALKIATKHADRFAAGVGLSASYKAPIDKTTGDLFRGDEDAERRADLFWLLRNEPPPPVSLLVTSSKQGESNYADTLRFVDAVRAPTRVSTILLESGGHNFHTWRREIPAAMEWLSGRLRAD